ncbi:MAG TPA: endonuclease V, partial [Candidatus Bathyarchaeia archaeon]|nr:endonuclease V [Candidatus Bathyarchaeia archaeon]
LPGFLGFREGKLLAGAIDRLHVRPDVFLVDGHGKAHPRRFGLACHLGLAISRPTIGVAKSHFYGNIDGETIFDLTGEVIGVIASTNLAKRYFVSIGNNIGLDDAKELVQRCTVNNYIAPLRAAHSEAVRQIRDLE